MCFFKKKAKLVEKIDSKFELGEGVLFRNHRNELTNGYIYSVRLNEYGNVIYDVQVGGECPAIYEGISEDKIIKKPNKK